MKRKRAIEANNEPSAKVEPKRVRTKRVLIEPPLAESTPLTKKRKNENGTQAEITPSSVIKKNKSDTKKKVRIDETEGLKAKKEMAEAESHFSAKQLPAKIIKSKANKNLTEEVKVSPITIQDTKKVHGTRGRKALGKSVTAARPDPVDESYDYGKTVLVSNGLNDEESKTKTKLRGNRGRKAMVNIKSDELVEDNYDVDEKTELLSDRLKEVETENEAKLHGTRGRRAIAKTKIVDVVEEIFDDAIETKPFSNGLNEDDSESEVKVEDVDLNGIKQEHAISDESDLEVFYIEKKKAEKEAQKEAKLKIPRKSSTLMPKEDQLILTQRVLDAIPEGDQRSYKYRLQNLEWQNVAFNNYTIDQCQKVWTKLTKRVRCHRLLSEVAADVKNMIEINDMPAARTKKTVKAKRHPDMPKRPLSSYFLYYIKQRDKVAKEHPNLDTVDLNKHISELYQNLPADKKQKYDTLADKYRVEYRIKMAEFLAAHPEFSKNKQVGKIKKEKPPTKPLTPLKLFMQSEANREEIALEDRHEFKEVCREKWRHMSDSKKLIWINLAEQHHAIYIEQLNEYMSNHPEYKPKTDTRTVLTRREIDLKEKLAGKPKKPATTAYGLFISMHSNEFPNIPPRERWNLTSIKWKGLPDEEKEKYKQLHAEAVKQYESDYQAYLESLSDEKREAEILKSMPKKRKRSIIRMPTPKKRAQAGTSKVRVKVENPQPPPRSACKYYALKIDSQDPKKDWKALSEEERKFYEDELGVIKEKYIKDFETYLKSLSKKELAEFSAQRNAQDESDSSDFYESDDDDDSSADSSDGSD